MSLRESPGRALRFCGATVLVFLLLATESVAAVRVYYFHRTVRCDDCLLIEQLSAETLRKTFSQELTDGRLEWRPINLDSPENIHFVFDYDLNANELVVVRGEASRPLFDKLPEVWNLVQQPDQFRSMLVNLVREHLAQPN